MSDGKYNEQFLPVRLYAPQQLHTLAHFHPVDEPTSLYLFPTEYLPCKTPGTPTKAHTNS